MQSRFRRLEIVRERELLEDFIKRVDKDYFPPISQREGGIEGQIEETVAYNGDVVVYDVNGVIEGAAMFFPVTPNKEVVEFSLFSFTKQYRGSLKPYLLARYLLDNWSMLGYSNTKRLVGMTWYEESVGRVKVIGFEVVKIVPMDIIPERISYYFEGSVEFVAEKLKELRASKDFPT
jgi:hypothetical protein